MSIPGIIYGTAWKKELTQGLVLKALQAGYSAIDTACQPRHYREDLVSEAIKTAATTLGIQRKDIFLQTKFTPPGGQDPDTTPYDRNAPLEEQVRQSVDLSLARFQYLDSLVLHSPLRTHEATMRVWRVFEEYHQQGVVRMLGISNIYSLKDLRQLWTDASVKPRVVQNRFHESTQHDREIRRFCREYNIVYQSFWTLTGNPEAVRSEPVRRIAAQRNATPEQVFLKFVIQLGITPLTGTSSETHMRQDLQVLSWPDLSKDDIDCISEVFGEPIY
ncbi:NADP-dependent oxidoreductase domain-containing protein [Polychytrium aggregatum]|uniref:NADP-dependent oxidoreductase domain-containing protein n=1 Tax=Polychytrium aggregatum TaxID=110093 RepID=UPI0022FDFA5E|nr:NADP-dependent oxidoreductase domain-containing protein [Polychytrium aggregatum]KAI9203808.1 NADP-dependent oxidoreductase domain-containing protein [Polychytrium aggregatum]